MVAVVGAGTGGAAIIHDRRTTGTFVDDQITEFKAKSELGTDQELWEQSHINVTSFNGVMLLSGEAPNELLRERATELVKRIPKVKIVHNEIAVIAPSSALSRSSDAWITGKVKTSLIGSGDIDAIRIKVVTERGIVYLMGIVTRQESEIATDIVRRVGGVQRVIRLFEYIQPDADGNKHPQEEF